MAATSSASAASVPGSQLLVSDLPQTALDRVSRLRAAMPSKKNSWLRRKLMAKVRKTIAFSFAFYYF